MIFVPAFSRTFSSRRRVALPVSFFFFRGLVGVLGSGFSECGQTLRGPTDARIKRDDPFCCELLMKELPYVQSVSTIERAARRVRKWVAMKTYTFTTSLWNFTSLTVALLACITVGCSNAPSPAEKKAATASHLDEDNPEPPPTDNGTSGPSTTSSDPPPSDPVGSVQGNDQVSQNPPLAPDPNYDPNYDPRGQTQLPSNGCPGYRPIPCSVIASSGVAIPGSCCTDSECAEGGAICSN
jgi:hypothetical protein